MSLATVGVKIENSQTFWTTNNKFEEENVAREGNTKVEEVNNEQTEPRLNNADEYVVDRVVDHTVERLKNFITCTLGEVYSS